MQHVAVRVAAVAALAAAWVSTPAGEIALSGTGLQGLSVHVDSIQEARFRSTIRQQYDFSCGSAAVATLLTHHYGRPTREDDVFRAMYEKGDTEKIRREGFSLLDMKRYLASLGYDADGFEVPLEKIAKERIPALALLQKEGYRHFVVVKGIDERDVLVGDPSAGTTAVPREQFRAMWNGIAFLVRNHADVGRKSFSRRDDWRARRRAPSGDGVAAEAAPLTLVLPQLSDF